MHKLEQNRNYTIKELIALSPECDEAKDFVQNLNANRYSKTISKLVIKTFQDFDENTKFVYSKIAEKIKELNSNQENLYVIASGSRVNGKWRTDEEAENIAKEFNLKKIKYSDYDFISNAKYTPNLTQLALELNVRYINKIGSYNKNEEVEIPL